MYNRYEQFLLDALVKQSDSGKVKEKPRKFDYKKLEELGVIYDR